MEDHLKFLFSKRAKLFHFFSKKGQLLNNYVVFLFLFLFLFGVFSFAFHFFYYFLTNYR